MARHGALGFIFLLAGCFAPNLGQGQIHCADDGSCPPNYQCAGDRRCYSLGSLPALDLSASDLAAPSDLASSPRDLPLVVTDMASSSPPDLARADLSSQCQPSIKCAFQQCGTLPNDGCGNVLHCGDCAVANTCSAQTANSCACTPAKSCNDVSGIHCGQYPDGCGGVMNCPACGVSQICGDANDAYTCGNQRICAPLTCQPGQCGDIPDGCAGVLHCGACPTGQICGAVGQANRCG